MRKFLVLIKKELRELVTFQMLIPLIIIVLLFVFIGKVIGTETKKEIRKREIGVVDFDKSKTSSRIIKTLSQSKFEVDVYKDVNINEAIKRAQKKKISGIIVIPKGFEIGLRKEGSQQIKTYTTIENFSLSGARQTEVTKEAIAIINELVSNQLISKVAPDTHPQELKNPIEVKEHVRIKDNIASASPGKVRGFVTMQTTFIPIVLFMVIIIAAQMIATAVATEKENKTLETLLSIPISRTALVTAKMVAAGLIALAMAGVYIIGFRYYMEGITGQSLSGPSSALMSEVIKDLGLVLNPLDYVVLCISLFLGILSALAIALIIGAFAEDVKSIQSLVAPLMVMILIPYFLVMFLDINSVSPVLKFIVYAIPFSHPFMAAPNLFLHNYVAVFYGIVYQSLFFITFAYIAGRIFSSDRILTMKLRLKRSQS